MLRLYIVLFILMSPGKTEAAVKNFSPYYRRQYSVAFCNHVRSEVEQHRDVTSQLLKTKVTRGHRVYAFLPLKNALQPGDFWLIVEYMSLKKPTKIKTKEQKSSMI